MFEHLELSFYVLMDVLLSQILTKNEGDGTANSNKVGHARISPCLKLRHHGRSELRNQNRENSWLEKIMLNACPLISSSQLVEALLLSAS